MEKGEKNLVVKEKKLEKISAQYERKNKISFERKEWKDEGKRQE